MDTTQYHLYNEGASPSSTIPYVTLGVVVDTNDPQQMGRVRAVCVQWGDSWNTPVEDLPWAVYMSPFGGHVQVGTRGPGVQESDGSLAYGMWAIPKVGAQVAMMCVDGNPMTRMYIGSVFDQFTPHTLPHGRFMHEDHPGLEKSGQDTVPYGPYTSAEKLVQPLAQNMKRAFNVSSAANHEYRTRGADYTATRVDVSQLDYTFSKAQDDKDVKVDGWTATQGYGISRQDPSAPSTYTDRSYDSTVYSWTSPGFHSISMDDRQENCRMRFRTTAGHQIIMDDTNERIYIATAQGNNWIELDQDGNIDVYTANKLSVHAAKEINFTSDDMIRFHAKKGIHMHSDADVRVTAATDIHVKAGSNLRLRSGANTNIQSGATTNVLAGGDIITTGSTIHFNGPTAAPAGEQPALWTNRVPQHEPYARVMTKNDMTHEPEFGYNDQRVNRVERGRTISRGMYWRR